MVVGYYLTEGLWENASKTLREAGHAPEEVFKLKLPTLFPFFQE
jgi:hypothetical protein